MHPVLHELHARGVRPKQLRAVAAWRLPIGLVAGLLLAAGVWGGCRGNGTRPDLGTHDSQPADRAVADRAVPDLGPPDWYRLGDTVFSCGGSRKVTLEPIVRGQGMACGKACQQVSFGAQQVEFEVSGNTLVYSGDLPVELGGGPLSIDRAVFWVDLAAGKEWLVKRPIPDRPGCIHVATDGKRLAYTCMIDPAVADGLFDLTLTAFDLASGVETDLQCFRGRDIKAGACAPASITVGDTGVGINMSLTTCQQIDTHFHRFSNNHFANVSHKHGGVWEATMSGSRMVWTEVVGPNTQIVLWDSVTNKKGVLAPHPADQFHPRFEGDLVVWVDHRNAPGGFYDQRNSDIYLHDLKTGQTVAVTTHAAMQDFPDVWGDWVVWHDWRNNPNPTPVYSNEFINADVFAKNVKTGQEVQLTSFPAMEVRPQVDNGRIFFRMGDPKKLSVFMIDLAAFLNN